MKKILNCVDCLGVLFLILFIGGRTVSAKTGANLSQNSAAFITSSAINSFHFSISFPDSTPLTKAKVRNYIKTRIATNRLQMKMKKNASQYDDVVQAFYKKRKVLLKNKGWEEEDFESTQERIQAASYGMDLAAEMKADEDNFKKEIAEIQSSKYYTKEQKEQLIKAEKEGRTYKRTHYIEPTKPDWAAVKPYRKALKQLTDWVSQNVSDPPDIH